LAFANSRAEVNYETITFLATDGHRYTKYTTTRSDAKTYSVFFDKSEKLEDYIYINPNEYELLETDQRANVLQFSQGSYGVLSQGDFVNDTEPQNSLVSVDREGIYTLRTWDGKKQSNGNYGFWNSPEDFSSFAAAWVFPDNLQLLEYHSNRRGEWVQRGNTLAFFATNSNDLTFEIRYRPVAQQTFSALKATLQDVEHVEVEQSELGVTVILENAILFASGSASLSDAGLKVISNLAESFEAKKDLDVIVSGHTDNVPITGSLAEIFPTNWELSAKRALNVVHALSSAGIEPQRLQARAFGPFQPRVANDSPENRSANRRIELSIVPANLSEPAAR
ncbi:MAG: OmpA family protein, partial [Pseudomonadota bacterium]